MLNLERRSEARHSMELPLWFHILLQAQEGNAIHSETSNVSRTGILMRSPLQLLIGAPVALNLRIPTQISGSARTFFQLFGHVVHELLFGDGELGYGIRLVRPLFANHESVPRNSGYATLSSGDIADGSPARSRVEVTRAHGGSSRTLHLR